MTLVAIDLEAAILGVLLLFPGKLSTVRPMVPDAVFTVPAHRALYAALQRVAERGASPDTITVREAVLGLPGAEEVTPELLTALAETTFSDHNVVEYAQRLREYWLRRQVVDRATQAAIQAENLDIPLRETLSTTVAQLVGTGQGLLRPALTMGQGMWQVMQDLETQAKTGPLVGIGTRLPDLDHMTHGWMKGELVIVAARPAIGKTSFALDLALAAVDVGPVVFVSLEMPVQQLRRRLLARESGVNLWHIRDDASMGRYARRLIDASGVLGKLPMHIVDTGDTPADVRLIVEHYAAEAREPVKLVVVDYLQLMRSGKRSNNRNEDLSDITRALKRTAMDLDVPIVVLSQLSRDSAKQNRRPELPDLRDSGAIEQDATVVVFLHEAAEQPEALRTLHPDTYVTEVLVRKNRHGKVGDFLTHHDRATGKWECVARPREYAA